MWYIEEEWERERESYRYICSIWIFDWNFFYKFCFRKTKKKFSFRIKWLTTTTNDNNNYKMKFNQYLIWIEQNFFFSSFSVCLIFVQVSCFLTFTNIYYYIGLWKSNIQVCLGYNLSVCLCVWKYKNTST